MRLSQLLLLSTAVRSSAIRQSGQVRLHSVEDGGARKISNATPSSCLVPEGVEEHQNYCCWNGVSLKRCQIESPECECPKECRAVEAVMNLEKLSIEKNDWEFWMRADLTPKTIRVSDVRGVTRQISVYDEHGNFVPGVPYVLFLQPEDDHNGAFSFADLLCSRINCWQKRHYQVVMRRVSTTDEAMDVISKFPDRSIHHVILAGHGSPLGLSWGGFSRWHGIMTKLGPTTKNFLRQLRQKLILVGSTVLLDSCSTAADTRLGQNFFKFVASHFPGSRVIGSQQDLSDDMFELADLGADCIAADTVAFRELGDNVTAASAGGLPKCSELSVEEMRY
eukprot:TRINITY_DN16476_c0_g1_i2.p1 TRINITY_DN16476_c0_g1~~TRINITY_DN16476_c0_g1_i2.p1  ORF type:complete len:336 (-),score=30.01 TRINITY_DN16476_c0_g1_i2:429-1436(-)